MPPGEFHKCGASQFRRTDSVMGQFETPAKNATTFRGHEVQLPSPEPKPTDPESAAAKMGASVGIVASSRFMTDGLVSAKVKFIEVDANSVCEFAFFRDVSRRLMVCAGLGGGTSAFGIREFAGD
jgi:hypothetical protein